MQFQDGALHGDIEAAFQDEHVCVLELLGREDAQLAQAHSKARSDAPDIIDADLCEKGVDLRLRRTHDGEHALILGVLLQDLIDDLGERLGLGDRDMHWEPCMLPDRHLHAATVVRQQVRVDVGAIEPGFVDAVHFLPRYEGGEGLQNAVGKNLIQSIIRAEQDDIVRSDQLLAIEERHATPDGQLFGFLAEHHHAAIVVGKHQYRPRADRAVEDTLDRDKEIRDVYQRQHGLHSVLLVMGMAAARER